MANIDLNEPMTFTVRNDYAFKKIFGSEKNKDILSEFICLITGLDEEQFQDMHVENSELQTTHYDSKAGRLDVKIRLKDGQKIDIEMQNMWFSDFTKRSIFYWAEMFTEDFRKGDDYWQLNKCIAINIVNQPFNLSNKVHSVFKILETEDNTLLDEALEIHFLDLTKIPQEKRTVLENWLLFIRTSEQEVRDMIAETSARLERANTQMKEFYSVDVERSMYIAARNAESDRVSMLSASKREGLAEGRAEGRAAERKIANQEIAQTKAEAVEAFKALKNLGVSSEKLSKATGMSIEEIEAL